MSALEESRWPSRLRGTRAPAARRDALKRPPYNGSVRLRETVAALPKEQN